MSFIAEKFKSFTDIISTIEEKLGILKFMQYVLFIFVMYVAFNFNSIVENVIKIQTEIEKKNHAKKLELRDDMMSDLNPLLVELRSKTGASRVLYFEYHNSTENFVGIPFKYANLVLLNQDYECPNFDPTKYKDINSGLISDIYTDLKKDGIIINEKRDSTELYHDIKEFFSNQDGSQEQVFINLPGVYSPMGMIILEWVDNGNSKNWNSIKNEINTNLPRINALISKYASEMQ